MNEAKKPSPPAEEKVHSSSNKDVHEHQGPQPTVSKTEATAVDKTKALESMTLSELAETTAPAKSDERAVVKEEDKKLTIGQKIKKELQHYWDGTKLLATEVKISSKLALKMAAGYELSRRENRQVSMGTCPRPPCPCIGRLTLHNS